MSTQSDPFGRTDLHLEIRRLLAARRGVGDAEALRSKLPCLESHPAVVARLPATGGRGFQRGLEGALSEAIAGTEEDATTKAAIRWHLALDKAVHVDDPEARLKRALDITGLSENSYWKGRKGKKRPVLSIALESVEAALDDLGRVDDDRPSLKVGGIDIRDVLTLAACRQGHDMTEQMTVEFEDARSDPRADCAEWPLLSRNLVATLTTEAKAAGRKFANGPALDLVRAEELDSEDGAPPRYRLGVAETSYNRWAATANSLDRDLSAYREITEQLGASTLRQGWGHAPNCLEDLAELPAPCLVGVCVVVVAEGQIVVLERQRKHYVAGAEPSSADRLLQPRRVHFVGEGAEPADLVAGQTPPGRAALRGCQEELGLQSSDIELVPTALVLDTLRWQPLFCYVALCRLSIADLEVAMQDAKHSDETGRQISVLLPWTVTDSKARALLTGGDPAMRLASNHAEAALFYALVYVDGLDAVASETTAGA